MGQHYLVDQRVILRMVEEAGIRPGERVLEIGTGRGELTKELAVLGAEFEGYELDKENYQATLEIVKGTRAKIILADAFDSNPDFDVLVASLPYSRSADFVDWLAGRRYGRAVVLLQKDFVEKILAAPGDRDYRAVSALAQISSVVQPIQDVGRASFSPHPRVSSTIVRFVPRLRLSQSEIANVKRLFSLRRRRVTSALAELGMPGKSKHFGTRRVYSLAPDEVHGLCSEKS